jgi:hypothetical protein
MPPPAHPTPALLLRQVLRLLRPLVRLLVRQGVHYPAFAAALKPLFLEAALTELARHGKPATDSAVSLMSGVHRRDVRELTRAAAQRTSEAPQSLSFSSEVVAHWLADEGLSPRGKPRALKRHGEIDSFDALVATISRDVRPRAVLDEMLRLGVAVERGDEVLLASAGFAPRQDLADMAAAMADNLHDHAAAAAANLQGDANHLDQAMYVDELTPASITELQAAARQAWQAALKTMMAKAQARYDHDTKAGVNNTEPKHRARFGVYFYSDAMSSEKDNTP